MADFHPFLTRIDRPPVPDDRLDDAVRSNLKALSDHAEPADLPAVAAQLRALGRQRRRWRILSSVGLIAAAAIVAVIIALTGTSSPSSSAAPLDLAPGATTNKASKVVEALPPTDPAHDVGYLTAAQLVDGHLVVTFDRVSWLTGPLALKHNGGVLPPSGHLIVNNNTRLRTFVVDDGAALIGNVQLGDHRAADSTQITRNQLIERTATLVGSRGRGPLVTLEHRFGADGPVFRLVELGNP